MTAPLLTPADARLLRVLATLAAVQEPRRRAAHLMARCEDLARRIERALSKEGE